MRVAINHLTRMQPGYICVAGIDLDTGRNVRPVLNSRLRRNLLALEGGVFEIGRVVELGVVKYVGRAPETEDYLFDPANAKALEKLSDKQFWNLVSKSAAGSLNEIFGDDLHPQGRGLALSMNKGKVSLGCLRTKTPPILSIAEFFGKERLRVCILDAGTEYWISVTDIRLYEKDQATLKYDQIHRLTQLLRKGEEAVMCVGLARPWLKPGDTERRHWLQLNNIHLKNHPF